MIRTVVLCIVFISFLSCERRKEAPENKPARNALEAKGTLVPPENRAKPEAVYPGKLKRKKAGKGRIIHLTDTNQFVASIRQKVRAGTPVTCIPGSGQFTLPNTIVVRQRKVLAGKPEIVDAGELSMSNLNPYTISLLGKRQGLNANMVHSLVEDINGNLWFGTAAGISRYDGKYFAHYTKAEGLGGNFILSLLFDKNGNLWIGTAKGGVSMFDGQYFTNFSVEEGFPDRMVTSLLEDKAGNIWFGTNSGIVRYDGRTFSHWTEKEGLVNNSVNSICEEADGCLWFGTANGASRFDGHSFHNFNTREGLSNREVNVIFRDKKGNLWFGTSNGITQFDGKTFSFLTMNEGLTSNNVHSILEDRDGNMWFGTWGGGLCKYDGRYIVHFAGKEGLVNTEILTILQDKRGTIWFGTRGGGAGRYIGQSFQHFTTLGGLILKQVQSIFMDSKGYLWLGTWGGGVCRFDGRVFTKYLSEDGLLNDDVRSIYEDRDGTMWFGTWDGVCSFDGTYFTFLTRKNGLRGDAVISILQDTSGNMWFGTERGGVALYDGKKLLLFGEKEGLSGEDVTDIIQDKTGCIWMATENGVTKYDPSGEGNEGSGTFYHYTEKEGLKNNRIVSLLEDRRGNIWIGTYGGGVTVFDGKSFISYSKKEGLSNDGIMSILEDSMGNLWFGTRTGISKMIIGERNSFNDAKRDQRPVIFKNITYEDGFLGVGCNANAMCEDRNHDLWIGANDRLTKYHPAVERLDTIPPQIRLTGIELFNEEINWEEFEKNKEARIKLNNGVIISHVSFDRLSKWYGIPDNLSLANENNFLTFNFVGITTKSPQHVSYQYELTGNDQSWKSYTKRTFASFGNLSPGDYRFRVRAMNSEGYWSEPYNYNFTIRPPWWKTNWAYLFYTLAFILGIILVDRVQTYRVIAKERKKTIDRELKQARIIAKAYEELNTQNEIVERQKNELENEKKLSDKLLRNILPAEVADELKEKGFAKAKLFNEVTVLFTDFKDFTSFSQKVSPQELVAEIHECFSAFDNIMEKYGVEKIKTIGDSYMAAGGIPVSKEADTLNVVKAALEIQEFMYEHKLIKEAAGEYFMEIRIGIHTGPVVAGIVGMKKFAYDIWGDTVNTASHVEKSCEVGRVSISRSTYRLVKDSIPCEHRGKIELKNKGTLDLYYAKKI